MRESDASLRFARNRFGQRYLVLDPTAPAGHAVGPIYGNLLTTIRENLGGVRAATPGRYLHDFRVAMRRTRVGLRQLKGVYPGAAAKRFAHEFRWITQQTNVARDLEVFLSARQRYSEAIGSDRAPGLEPLFAGLATELTEQRDRAATAASSRRFRDLLDDWDRWLGAEPPLAPRSTEAIATVAARAIRRAHDRVVHRGQRLNRRVERGANASERGSAVTHGGRRRDIDAKGESLHRLRLQCKKLRYLLEFFRSLCDGAACDDTIGELRRLQDRLGYLNDLRVHARWVRAHAIASAPGAAPGTPLPANAAAAIRALATHIDNERRRESDIVTAEIAEFLAPGRRRRCDGLLADCEKTR